MDKPNTPATGEQQQQTDAPATGAPAESQTPAPTPKPEDALGDAGKRALQAERQRAEEAEKRAKAAEARAKQYEDAQKTEAEKQAERLAAAEAKAARADRLEVALKKGLPLELVDRLRGNNPEELAADADTLLQLVKPQEGATPPAGEGEQQTPPPGSLDGGARPPAPKKTLQEQIAEASAAGDWAKVQDLNASLLEATLGG